MTTLGRIALSITLAVSGLSAGVPTLAQTDADPGPAPAPLAEREVFGFLPYWELSRASSIDFDVLTTLAWFGVEAGRDSKGKDFPSRCSNASACRRPTTPSRCSTKMESLLAGTAHRSPACHTEGGKLLLARRTGIDP